jgi:hypothetical protein
MSQEDFETLLRFFKVLANHSRLKILGILASAERSVEELAALLELKEPTVSHHLARLKELDLVKMRPDGNTHFYRLDEESLAAMNKNILTPERMASLVEEVEYDAWERKILSNFIVKGRLKEIPASRKKRLVILKWLVSRFEEGVKYPEKEINETVKRYHPDFATIRREFIANKLMKREKGLYWGI